MENFGHLIPKLLSESQNYETDKKYGVVRISCIITSYEVQRSILNYFLIIARSLRSITYTVRNRF